MQVDVTGVARIRHADNDTVYTIDRDELNWDQVGADERAMGAEVTYEAVIEHPDLGNLTWTVWEYPVGAYNHHETNVGSHTLLENFRFGISDPNDAALDREARIQEMVDWFFENYEDPAVRTPYESAEGGYIWIWGGPYSAADEIGSNFSDEEQDLIDAAVKRVERDGIVDWAPTEGPDDYDPEQEDAEDGPEDEEASVKDEGDANGIGSSLKEILATIPPESSGPIFDRTQQGRVDLVDWDGTAVPDGDLLSALREQAAGLVTHLEGTNGHQDLLQALTRYFATVNAAPASIPRLYIEGVFLENTAAQCDSEIAAGERPPLPSPVSGGLASLRQLHGALIMSTPTGSDLVEAADRYRARPEEQDRLSKSILEVSHAIRDTPAVFGPAARELAELAASNAGKGQRPERSNHAASLLLKRMLAGAGRVLEFAAGAALMTVVGDGLAATGAGAYVMDGVTALGNSAWSFLVSNFDIIRTFAAIAGPDLVWLRQLMSWLQARR
jgi:hypothetical protein